MVTSIAVYVWPYWQLPSIKHESDTCTQLNADNPPVRWSRYSMSSGIVRMMPRVCRVIRDILHGQPKRMFLWIRFWGRAKQLKIEKGMMVLFIITVVRATNCIIWAPFKYNKRFYFSPTRVYLNSPRVLNFPHNRNFRVHGNYVEWFCNFVAFLKYHNVWTNGRFICGNHR